MDETVGSVWTGLPLMRFRPCMHMLNNARTAHLNSAFSAPRIWMVLAGALARFIRLPACEMRRAPTSSPTSTVRLGAMAAMRLFRYSYS